MCDIDAGLSLSTGASASQAVMMWCTSSGAERSKKWDMQAMKPLKVWLDKRGALTISYQVIALHTIQTCLNSGQADVHITHLRSIYTEQIIYIYNIYIYDSSIVYTYYRSRCDCVQSPARTHAVYFTARHVWAWSHPQHDGQQPGLYRQLGQPCGRFLKRSSRERLLLDGHLLSSLPSCSWWISPFSLLS